MSDNEKQNPAQNGVGSTGGSALPCPFCGRSPEMKSRASTWNKTGTAYFVVCFCGGNAARAHIHADTQEGAVALWNTRHQLNPNHEPTAPAAQPKPAASKRLAL